MVSLLYMRTTHTRVSIACMVVVVWFIFNANETPVDRKRWNETTLYAYSDYTNLPTFSTQSTNFKKNKICSAIYQYKLFRLL